MYMQKGENKEQENQRNILLKTRRELLLKYIETLVVIAFSVLLKVFVSAGGACREGFTIYFYPGPTS
jgi:hypothetical protein